MQNGKKRDISLIVNAFIKKIKQLYDKGAFHIILGTFATKFVAFFGSIFVVRLLSKDEYGLVGYVENIYSYAFVIAGLGLSNAVLRYVVIMEDEHKRNYFNYIVKHSVVRNIVISALLIGINFFIPYPEGFREAKYLLPILALLLPFQDLVNDTLYSLRALFKNKQYAFISFIVSVSLILGRVEGAIVDGCRGVIVSRVIINAFFGVCLLLYISQLFLPSEREGLQKIKIKEINVYSLQYMVTNGLWMVFSLNDIFILGIFCSNPSIVADYKVAYVLPGNIAIISNAIAIFISPYFTKNESNLPWVKRNFKKAYLTTALALASVVLVIFILAKPLIVMLYGDEYVNVVGLMRVLLIAAYCNAGLRYTTANLLAAMGQIKYNMAVSFFGMAVQIVLDIVLVQRYQSMGIAFASCIVYFSMALILLIIFQKKYFRDSGQGRITQT